MFSSNQDAIMLSSTDEKILSEEAKEDLELACQWNLTVESRLADLAHDSEEEDRDAHFQEGEGDGVTTSGSGTNISYLFGNASTQPLDLRSGVSRERVRTHRSGMVPQTPVGDEEEDLECQWKLTLGSRLTDLLSDSEEEDEEADLELARQWNLILNNRLANLTHDSDSEEEEEEEEEVTSSRNPIVEREIPELVSDDSDLEEEEDEEEDIRQRLRSRMADLLADSEEEEEEEEAHSPQKMLPEQMPKDPEEVRPPLCTSEFTFLPGCVSNSSSCGTCPATHNKASMKMNINIINDSLVSFVYICSIYYIFLINMMFCIHYFYHSVVRHRGVKKVAPGTVPRR